MIPLFAALMTLLPNAQPPTPNARRVAPHSATTIRVDAADVRNRVTRWMYGSCIEDVNHEIYGGLYAQQIFGESFEEPPAASPLAGWTAYGGAWTVDNGTCHVATAAGAKLVREAPEFRDGSVACDVQLPDGQGDNAGLILRVSDPHVGADAWIGYEISLSARNQSVILGRHHNDWHPLRTAPAVIAVGRWYRLRVELAGPSIRIFLDEARAPVLEYTDADGALPAGKVGLRTWNSNAAFRNLTITLPPSDLAQSKIVDSLDQPAPGGQNRTSGMWDAIAPVEGGGHLEWDSDHPYNSAHAQRLTSSRRASVVGIVNQGLNRWGIAIKAGHVYAGHFYLRRKGDRPSHITVLLIGDGKVTAEQQLPIRGNDWSRIDFSLESSVTDPQARFAIWLDRPGTVWVDQVYLSPTGPDLFHGLPVRADIGQMLVSEGLTFLRYGGSMINAPAYRWKAMIGDRDRRPQYAGTWYPYSTNGFGIEEFVQFCEAAKIEPAFAINIEETPEDAADLVEYLNGPATSPWGRRRAKNGHPRPYGVKFIEIGNEETTNAHYLERFKLLEAAMRQRDPHLQLVIAAWWEPDNPVSRQIVQELNGKAAFWDVHVGGDDLHEGANVDTLFTRMEKLVQEWAPGTALKAVVFEENGGRHDLQRALGHARILNATQRHGDFVLVDCPANCLQPLGQNDNGWDQGQVFFTPDRVWGMPPYYAQQMAAANHLPLRVASTVSGGTADLDVTATRSQDGHTLVLKVVNVGAAACPTTIQFDNFAGVQSQAETWTLTGALNAINTPKAPEAVRSQHATFDQAAERFDYTFPAYSYTILRLHR